MPGVPVQQLTPDQFKQWKLQKDQEKAQVCMQLCCSNPFKWTFWSSPYVQARLSAEQQREADISSGKVSLTGSISTG